MLLELLSTKSFWPQFSCIKWVLEGGEKKREKQDELCQLKLLFFNWLKCHHFTNRMILLLHWTETQELDILFPELTHVNNTTIVLCWSWHFKSQNVFFETFWLLQHVFLYDGCLLLCLTFSILRKLYSIEPNVEMLRFYIVSAWVKSCSRDDGGEVLVMSLHLILAFSLEIWRKLVTFCIHTYTYWKNFWFPVTSHEDVTGTIRPKAERGPDYSF